MTDNVYQSLLQNRIIFLGSEVRDENANAICAQMLLLNAEDPESDIFLYINSPGGSFTAMTAIYDTMRYIKPDVQTVCLGMAASAAAVLLAAGTKGKRVALPNSTVLIHQPSTGQASYGQSSDLEIQANEIMRIRSLMEDMIADATGQTKEQVSKDVERDKYLTAQEAKEYGLIDDIFESLKNDN